MRSISLAMMLVVTDMVIGAAVSARHGKRGWHVIPHADHVRSLTGLVHDGVLFSTSGFRRSTLQTRRPLLDPQTNAVHSEKDTNVAGSSADNGAGIEVASVVTGHTTPLHAAAAVGNLSELHQWLENVWWCMPTCVPSPPFLCAAAWTAFIDDHACRLYTEPAKLKTGG